MDKYINSTKVLNFIQDCLNHEDKISDTEKATLIAIQRYIERTQIEDVASVVRCIDCKHWHRSLSDDGKIEFFNFSYCEKGHCGFPNFFCADGERKDGDGE